MSAEVDDPHAILVRSANLHGMETPESLLAVGRAGSGTNNIPIPNMSARASRCSTRRAPTPMPSRSSWWRHVARGTQYRPRAEVPRLPGPRGSRLENKIEAAKKAFNGFELTNHTLGVIGLGKVGCLVADARSSSACM